MNEALQLRRIFQQAPGFICTLSGPEHIFTFVNDEHHRMFGSHEWIGKPVRDAFPDLAGQGFYELLDRVYATGEQHVARSAPATYRREPGEPERTIFMDFIYAPVIEDGRVTGIMCQGSDVTDRHLAEHALLRREEQLRLATEAAEVSLWDVDVVTDTLFWPPRVKAMFGISADVPVTMGDFYTGIHPDDRDRTAQAYADAADPIKRTVYDAEYRTIGKEDGRIRWVAAKGRGVFDQNGDCVRVIGTAIDITARKATEERLRELNADLERQVIQRTQARGRTWQVTPDLMGALNSAGYFETSNPAWQTVLGWSEAEVATMSIFELLHPDDVERTRDEFDMTQQGQPVLRFPNRYRCKDGSYRWISWVGVPEDGMVYCTGRDITEERLQAAELAARTAEIDRLWRNSQDLLVVIDAEATFKAVSPAVTRILGYVAEDVIGRTVLDFLHPDDREPTLAALNHAITSELPTFENRYRHKDGSYRWLSWVAAPEGELIYATARHITLEKQVAAELATAQETLRQAQKIEAIGQLTGGVAHDFNNLLMVISGGLNLLERSPSNEKRQRLMEGMRNAVQRGAALSKQLLAFARRKPLVPQTVDLSRQIDGMSELLDRTLRGDVQVKTEFVEGLWPVEVDPAELELVLLNLCVNARDAMPNGGTIKIEADNVCEPDTGLAGDYVRLSVIDTGTGMTPEVQAKIFEPFFTTKEIGKGSGLGMPQVYGFIQQSGGTIRVRSAIGEGTAIDLLLPRSYAVALPETRQLIDFDDQAPVEQNAGAILLVEDDDEVAALVSEMLDELGYEVTRAASPAAALGALANDRAVDLVFSDVMMPGGMNGVELAREIRRRKPNLPVLLTSGYAEAAAREAAVDDIPILPKPYQIADLGAALARIRS